jgi:hypothetical protein
MGKETGKRIVRGLFEIDRVTTIENRDGMWLMPITEVGHDLLYELDSDDNVMPREDV